jgi:CRISPR-associated protein Cas6
MYAQPPPLDLVFPVCGTTLAAQHSYPLYAAISRLLPWVHDPGSRFALAPVTGRYVGGGRLRIEAGYSHLRLRLSAAELPRAVSLAGKGLEVLGQRIRLGVPHVEALQPVPDLLAHTVTIKHATDAEAFARSARERLDELGIGGRLEVPSVPCGPRRGEPMRQVLRVKDAVLVCYALRVRELKPEESLRLQEVGLGGKRRMGGGFFLPVREQNQ